MIWTELALAGAFLIEPERLEDERGFFARTWSRDEFAARGLATEMAQCNISFSARKGTLRGLHYQAAPHEEVKLVRCTSGALYDVILDLRTGSPTWGQWAAAELSAENRRTLYVPQGFAHGFQTLAEATEASYQVSEYHHPESERGVRWDDPAFGVRWPLGVTVISARDRTRADFKP